MKQKVKISENLLKKMIVRALNESMLNKPDIDQHKAIYDWAEAVREGAEPTHCREFINFYYSMINDYRCRQAVILGIAAEIKNQAGFNYKEEKQEMFSDEKDNNVNYNVQDIDVTDKGMQHTDELTNQKPRKKALKILDMINGSHIDEDILNNFFSGIDCIKKEESSIPDSFKGENVIKAVTIYFQQGETNFMTYLCRLIKFYSGHYCRNNYTSLLMQYGVGSNSIGGDKSNAIQDYNPDNNDTENSGEYELNGSTDENKYYEKMKSLVEKILNDQSIGLGPQERTLLQTLLNVSREPLPEDKIAEMEGLSDKQQQMVIYRIMSERTGIPVDKIQRSLSAAIQKAKKSKYAKQLAEKKQQLSKQLINEVMRRIIKKYTK